MQSAVAFVLAAAILMIGWAYFRTPHIKIGGQIRSAYAPHREPDPPLSENPDSPKSTEVF